MYSIINLHAYLAIKYIIKLLFVSDKILNNFVLKL